MVGAAVSSPLRFTSVSTNRPLGKFRLIGPVSDVLDGSMITLATYCLNIFHPGPLLGSGKEWKRPRGAAETIKVEAAEKQKESNESDIV